MGAETFLKDLYANFSKVHDVLKEIIKEEELLEENILTSEKGFLIRRYSIRRDQIKPEVLTELKRQLGSVMKRADTMKKQLAQNTKELGKIEMEYNARMFAIDDKRRVEVKLISNYMNVAIRNAQLARVRIDEIINMSEKRKMDARKLNTYFESLEKMTNQILKFVDLTLQMDTKIRNFESTAYYPSPQLFGRAMGDNEFKATKKTNILKTREKLAPAFRCTPKTLDRIKKMSKDEKKNFFQAIGVRKVRNIVFFRTRVQPINPTSPIRQSNGLYEFKFPNKIPIEIVDAA